MADAAGSGATGATGGTGATGASGASGGVTSAGQTGAGQTGPSIAPGTSLVKSTPGETVTAKIHALHAASFAGTALANHTDLWNLVMDFKTKVIALVEEAYADAVAKL